MGVLLRHIVRSIFEKKFRTIIIIFAIIASTAIIYINFHLKDVIIESYSSFYKETSGETDILITDEVNYLFQENDIELDELNVNLSIPFLVNLGKYEDKENKKTRIALIGIDEKSAEEAKLMTILQQEDNEKFDGDKIIVSHNFINDHKLELGQEIDLTINDEKTSFKIYGIASKSGLFYDETMQSQVLLPLQSLNSLVNQSNVVSGVYLDVGNDDIEKSIQCLEEANQELTVQSTIDKDAMNEQVSMISMVLIIALILMIILAGTVLSAMYKHIQNDRLPSIATFKSIGANRFTTNTVLIIETVIYGVFGGVLGVMVAHLGMPYIYDIVVTNQLMEIDIKLDLIKATYSILLVIVIAILITSTTIRSLDKRSLKDSIFNTIEGPYNISKTFTVIGGILVFMGVLMSIVNDQYDTEIILALPMLTVIGFSLFVPFLNHCIIFLMEKAHNIIKPTVVLAMKNNKKSKVIIQNIRVSSIIAAIVISIFSISIAFSSLFSQAHYLNADVVVHLDEYTAEEDTEAILELDGVNETLVFFVESLKMRGKDNQEKHVQVVGRDKDDKLDVIFPGAIRIGDYAVKDLTDDEMIIDEKLLQWLGSDIGDFVTLQFEDQELKFRVKGTMDSYKFASGSNTIFIPKKTYMKEVTDKPTSLYLTSEISPDEQVSQIEDKLLDTNSTVLTFKEFINVQEDMVNSIMFLVNLVVITGLLIGLLGIINNLVIGYLSRKKEFSVLYSCAMNKKQLKKVMFSEVILHLTISLLLCLGLSFILVFQLNAVLEYLEVGIQLTYPYNFMLIIFALIIVIEIISTIFMFKIITNLQVMKELRYE